MTHELKCWQPYFNDVFFQKKTFEVRKNDRNYHIGDLLMLREFEPCARCGATGHRAAFDCDYEVAGSTLCPSCEGCKGLYIGPALYAEVSYVIGAGGTVGRITGLQPGYCVLGLCNVRGVNSQDRPEFTD